MFFICNKRKNKRTLLNFILKRILSSGIRFGRVQNIFQFGKGFYIEIFSNLTSGMEIQFKVSTHFLPTIYICTLKIGSDQKGSLFIMTFTFHQDISFKLGANPKSKRKILMIIKFVNFNRRKCCQGFYTQVCFHLNYTFLKEHGHSQILHFLFYS